MCMITIITSHMIKQELDMIFFYCWL